MKTIERTDEPDQTATQVAPFLERVSNVLATPFLVPAAIPVGERLAPVAESALAQAYNRARRRLQAILARTMGATPMMRRNVYGYVFQENACTGWVVIEGPGLYQAVRTYPHVLGRGAMRFHLNGLLVNQSYRITHVSDLGHWHSIKIFVEDGMTDLKVPNLLSYQSKQ